MHVVETKGSNWWDDLRHKEGAKIKCGEKHFAVLATGGNPAKYIKATNVADMLGNGLGRTKQTSASKG